MTIRSKMISINAIIALVVTLFLGQLIYKEWTVLQTFTKISQASRIVSAMASATIELSLERSLSQVALNLSDPISPQIREMLDQQRTVSTKLFKDARALLVSSKALDKREKYAAELDSMLSEIDTLRGQVDSQVGLDKASRSQSQVEDLPTKIKSSVSDLNSLSFKLRSYMEQAPADILAADMVVQRAWAVREFGGRERTLFAIATAERQPLTKDDLVYMTGNHGRVVQAWAALEREQENLLLAPVVREAIKTLGQSYFEEYDAIRGDLFASSNTGDYPMDFGSLFQQSEAALQTAISLLNVAVESNVTNIDSAYSKAWFRLTVDVVVALFILSLVGFGIVFSVRNVAGTIGSMTLAMTELAQGNTDVEVPGEGRTDEVGAMAKALVTFRDNMVERVELEKKSRNEQAGRERRQHLVEEAISKFETAATSTVSAVTGAVNQLQNASQSMSENAQNSVEQSGRVLNAAETASSNVQTVASASEELSASIQEIMRSVNEVAEMSAQSADSADQCSTKVTGLAEAGQKIGDVVSLIQAIAEQTNLLALNATIEAARAGEAGKGFAIVAAEVKELASQTAGATEQISEQVQAVQNETQNTVDSINSIATSIRSVNEIAGTVRSLVGEQGQATNEIARNVQDAAEGTKDVSSNIKIVSDAASGTGDSAQDVLSASDELSQQAIHLQQNISEFLDAIRAA